MKLKSIEKKSKNHRIKKELFFHFNSIEFEDLDKLNLYGITPLIHTIMHDYPKLLDDLLFIGIDINQPCKYNRYSALTCAIELNKEEAFYKLINIKNIDVNFIDIFGRTPLLVAKEYNRINFYNILLSKGANI